MQWLFKDCCRSPKRLTASLQTLWVPWFSECSEAERSNHDITQNIRNRPRFHHTCPGRVVTALALRKPRHPFIVVSLFHRCSVSTSGPGSARGKRRAVSRMLPALSKYHPAVRRPSLLLRRLLQPWTSRGAALLLPASRRGDGRSLQACGLRLHRARGLDHLPAAG